MKNKRAILLLSGGIDSTTLLAHLSQKGYQIYAISFDYGQKHQIEIEFAIANAKKYQVHDHKIINLDPQTFQQSALVDENRPLEIFRKDSLPQGPVNAYVPFRNLIFLSYALSYAEILSVAEVFIAFNKDDKTNFWDCSTTFLEYINMITKLSDHIQVKAPFIELSKKEVIIFAQQLNINLEDTLSCYQPYGSEACGVCLSCTIINQAIAEINDKNL